MSRAQTTFPNTRAQETYDSRSRLRHSPSRPSRTDASARPSRISLSGSRRARLSQWARSTFSATINRPRLRLRATETRVPMPAQPFKARVPNPLDCERGDPDREREPDSGPVPDHPHGAKRDCAPREGWMRAGSLAHAPVIAISFCAGKSSSQPAGSPRARAHTHGRSTGSTRTPRQSRQAARGRTGRRSLPRPRRRAPTIVPYTAPAILSRVPRASLFRLDGQDARSGP